MNDGSIPKFSELELLSSPEDVILRLLKALGAVWTPLSEGSFESVHFWRGPHGGLAPEVARARPRPHLHKGGF